MNELPSGRPSFWLLADNSVSLGGSPNRLGTFVASLKHALLFHERILLSDSLVVNTPNFRQLIQADQQLRDYLTEGCLVIARRRKGEGVLDLVELRENFLASNSRNPGFDANPKSFMIDDDLRDLQNLTATVSYDPSATRDHYTNSMAAVTAEPRFRNALRGDADVVRKVILERIQEKQCLDQTFLGTSGPGSLAAVLGEEIWHRVSSTIFDFQTAFYYSAIPTTVGADIVFSEEHERQRKILRHIGADSVGWDFSEYRAPRLGHLCVVWLP